MIFTEFDRFPNFFRNFQHEQRSFGPGVTFSEPFPLELPTPPPLLGWMLWYFHEILPFLIHFYRILEQNQKEYDETI